ncbi:UNVERIFIED_CONTAM: hypothetical protein RMT77_003616 [Armadillidium vulgare]
MSLKINVIYKGIIYRIKGIKVLCSVVWTVIILLAAIIGMGVWMIINVYDGSTATSLSFVGESGVPNNLNDSYLPEKEAPFIDFGKSDNTNPSRIPSFNMKMKDFEFEDTKGNVASPKPTTLKASSAYSSTLKTLPPKLKTESTSISDDKVYESDSYDYESYDHYESEEELEKEPDIGTIRTEFVPSERVSESDKRQPLKLNNNDGFIPIDIKAKHISTNIQSKDTEGSDTYQEYSPFYELNYPSMERPKTKIPTNIPISEWKPKNEMRPTYIRKPPPRKSFATNQVLRRAGTPVRKSLVYRGPPVVGYGLNPYEKLTRERIKEYDQFWETYAGKKANVIFRSNETQKISMRPHLRGLRPTGSEYDLPIRPDAQLPERQVIRQRPNRIIPMPPTEDPNRKLMIAPSTTESPIVHVLNPLQELYDYSKKLAASLLSFNSKSAEEIHNSSQKLAEYGVNLIESHNKIFKNSTRGPFDRIVALIPNAEKLRSMDPFELSLITWTFLDFWEFLIEKVGTLSDEDLVLLQERIESLRKRKDNAMTQVFVNETLIRYTPGNQRSISKDRINVQDIFSREKYKSEDIKSPVDYKIKKESEHILLDLFPAITSPKSAEELSSNPTTTAFENFADDENSELGSEENIKEPLDDHITTKNYSSQSIKIMQNETKISSEREEHIPETDINLNSDKISSNTSPANIPLINPKPVQQETVNSVTTENTVFIEEPSLLQSTIMKLVKYLKPMKDKMPTEIKPNSNSSLIVEGRSSNWNPFGLFTSESRMQFMQFAVKVLFNFGKVYLKKPYALDCTMLLFCKDLNRASRSDGMEAMAAKLKGVGLKVLTESDKQLRETDTFSEVWRSVTAWTPLKCDVMFPRCDGPKALEIVNEVALGGN